MLSELNRSVERMYGPPAGHLIHARTEGILIVYKLIPSYSMNDISKIKHINIIRVVSIKEGQCLVLDHNRPYFRRVLSVANFNLGTLVSIDLKEGRSLFVP